MPTINSSATLKAAILQLEAQRAAEGQAMKADFHLAYERVRPINLIRNTFRQVEESQDLSDNIISIAAGLTSGYLSKTLFIGTSHNPFKKMLGTVLMYGVANVIAHHPDAVKSVGGGLLNLIKSIPWDGIHPPETDEPKANGDPT